VRILVTGVAGFIGSHVGERLLARGDEVVGLDNFDPLYPRSVKQTNLAPLAAMRFVEGDILDAALLDELMASDIDAVIHLAALAGVRPSLAEPWRYQEVNVVGTARVVEAMHKHGVRRLVFASSSSVYGDNTEVPYAEAQRVDLPASPYAASKRAGELLLRSLQRVHGFDCSCLRYFTVYGPRQRPEMAIHKFCRLVEAGQPLPMFGDGTTSRDYTYVDDVVAGTLGALDRAPPGFHIYNLGNTQPVPLRELIERIGEALGKEPVIERHPLQPGDVLQTWASVEAAQRDLGYRPSIDLSDGLVRFVSWLRAHG
jgi:UDP-glucuronate 4-epimerase